MSLLFILLTQLQILGAISLDWSDILDPIGELFLGDGADVEGVIGDNLMIVGLFIFLVLFIMTLTMGLGMLIGSVAIIPSLFAVFQWVPSLQIIVAIVCGLIFGFGLNRIIKR